MRSSMCLAALILSGSLSAPAKDATPTNNVTRFNGQLYKDLSVEIITPDGATFKHAAGTFTIPLDKLPAPIAIRFKDQVRAALEQKAKANDLKEKQAKYPGYEVFQVTVVQVFNNGILADQMKQIQIVSPAISSSLGSVGGGGGGVARSSYNQPVRSGKIIFIAGSFNGAFENEVRWVGAYPDGTQSYNDGTESRRTVQKWTALP